jgi:hypothetical protein
MSDRIQKAAEQWVGEILKGLDESMADVLRHDQDHDNWHKMHGDAPCTSEADCARKRAKYAEVKAEKGIKKGGPGSGRHKEEFSSKFESMRNYSQPSSKMTAKEMAAKRDESIANANKLEKEFHTLAIHGSKDSKANEKLAHLARMIAGNYRVAASLDPINHTAYDKQARSWEGRAFDLQETVMHTYSASEMSHRGMDARYVSKGGPGSGRHPQGWAGKYSGGAMSNYHDTRSEGQEDTSPAGQAHTDASNDHLNNYGYIRTSDGRSKAEITDRAEAMSKAQGEGIDEPTRLALMSDAINTNLGDGHQWFDDSIRDTASDHEELSKELREQGFTASADAHLAAAQAFNDLFSKGNFGNYTDEQLEEMANQANELAYTADSVTQDEIYRATQAPSRPADYKQSSVGAWLDHQEMLGKSSVRKGGPGSGRHPETGMPSNCGHRDFDPQTTVAQIGKMNILGLSGGRVSVLTEKNKPVGIELPIGHGYKVRVYLADNDTYTVQRVNVRAGKVNVKGEQTEVYADEVGEVAYNAGMYVNVSFGEDKR